MLGREVWRHQVDGGECGGRSRTDDLGIGLTERDLAQDLGLAGGEPRST